jgi:hypothetical protein
VAGTRKPKNLLEPQLGSLLRRKNGRGIAKFKEKKYLIFMEKNWGIAKLIIK